MILEKLELYDKALDILRKSNLAGRCYYIDLLISKAWYTTKVDGLNLVFQNVYISLTQPAAI